MGQPTPPSVSLATQTKRCCQCGEIKLHGEFYPGSDGKPRGRCKTCRTERDRELRAERRARQLASPYGDIPDRTPLGRADRERVLLQCVHCGGPFLLAPTCAATRNAVTCSKECSDGRKRKHTGPEKPCSKCGIVKPMALFQMMPNGIRAAQCRPCDALRTDGWRKRDPAKRQESRRDYTRRILLGMTRAEYLKLKPTLRTECAVCGGTTRLAVDHDHQTGVFRDMLCNPCNLIIGRANDDPEYLRKLAEYLERFQARATMPDGDSGETMVKAQPAVAAEGSPPATHLTVEV